MLVDSILKELLQLKEPSFCASCEEFFIPQLGERRLTGACCSCITESFDDARCTFEICNPRQDGHMKVDLKLSLNSHALPPFSWLFIFPIGWSPIQPQFPSSNPLTDNIRICEVK